MCSSDLSGDWVDIVHFTQAVGNGGTKRYFAKLASCLAETMFENASTLSAGSVRQLMSDAYRVRWTIGNSGVFTFSVTMVAVTDGN